MPKGIRIHEIVIGRGDPVERGMTVVVTLRMFLGDGSEVLAQYPGSPRIIIDLGKRDCIAGVRYGIEGMRQGGLRKLVISPHLGYGAKGKGECIPPDTVLHCEVGLLEIRRTGERHVEDFPPGKHLTIFIPGESARATPRIQCNLNDDGVCGVAVTTPVPGYGWRPARTRNFKFAPEYQLVAELFEEAMRLPKVSPADCIAHEQLWSDSSESANGITRDQLTNTLCVTISIYERGETVCHFSMKETSGAWLGSKLCKTLDSWLKPHLKALD